MKNFAVIFLLLAAATSFANVTDHQAICSWNDNDQTNLDFYAGSEKAQDHVKKIYWSENFQKAYSNFKTKFSSYCKNPSFNKSSPEYKTINDELWDACKKDKKCEDALVIKEGHLQSYMLGLQVGSRIQENNQNADCQGSVSQTDRSIVKEVSPASVKQPQSQSSKATEQ